MGHHVRSAPEVHQQRRDALAQAAERIGNGSQLTLKDFTRLNYDERAALRQASPETYDALQAGRTPGEAWRPSQGQGAAR